MKSREQPKRALITVASNLTPTRSPRFRRFLSRRPPGGCEDGRDMSGFDDNFKYSPPRRRRLRCVREGALVSRVLQLSLAGDRGRCTCYVGIDSTLPPARLRRARPLAGDGAEEMAKKRAAAGSSRNAKAASTESFMDGLRGDEKRPDATTAERELSSPARLS